MIRLSQILVFSFTLLASVAFGQSSDQDVYLTNEAAINSEKLEYSPAFYEDGIVFISSRVSSKKYKVLDKRIEKNIMSIFLARRTESGLLQNPEPFSIELLSTVHEGPITFDRTADNIFFTRNNIVKGKPKKGKDGIVKLKIYKAEKIGDKWSNIKELPFNDNDYNTAHPAIDIDGKVIYFASDRPGGMGGMDIWKSTLVGDKWGTPENMGPKINTDSDEIFPFVHADGTIFFASSGHNGFGGLDLFSFSQSQEVTNLGKPFNTEFDDFGFIIDRDKRNGYFSSNRTGGLGEDDIYSFYLQNPLDQVAGTTQPQGNRAIEIAVIDDESGEPIPGAAINYILVDELTLAKALIDSEGNDVDPNTNELLLKLPFGDGATKGTTDGNGVFPANVNYANYIFNIQKPGYQSRQVILTSDSEVNQFLITLTKAIPSTGIASNGTSSSNNGSTLNGTNSNNGTTGANNSNYSSNSGVNGQNGNSFNDNGSNTSSSETLVLGNTGSDGSVDFGASIREGTVIELPNIYYNFNDASIRPDAVQDLDVVLGLLNRYPDMQIELASHTDSRGSSRYNRRLSQKRAERAVAFLQSNGINSSRLRAVGYGEAELRNQCDDDVPCSETEHQYNRRTEVRVTKMSREINVVFKNSNNAPHTIDYASASSNSTTNYGGTGLGQADESYSGTNGSIQVITGLFANISNAQKRLNQVVALGFTRASVDSVGDMHKVVAGRYDSRSEAEEAARFLNSNSVKTYIKK